MVDYKTVWRRSLRFFRLLVVRGELTTKFSLWYGHFLVKKYKYKYLAFESSVALELSYCTDVCRKLFSAKFPELWPIEARTSTMGLFYCCKLKCFNKPTDQVDGIACKECKSSGFCRCFCSSWIKPREKLTRDAIRDPLFCCKILCLKFGKRACVKHDNCRKRCRYMTDRDYTKQCCENYCFLQKFARVTAYRLQKKGYTGSLRLELLDEPQPDESWRNKITVSYTHLTLPTIYSV